jgi:PAS domain S-box-containing protein
MTIIMQNKYKTKEQLIEELTDLQEQLKEYKKRENKDKTADNVFEQIIQNANDCIIIIIEGVVIFANHSAYKATGYSQADIIGRFFIDFVEESSKPALIENYKKRLAGDTSRNRYISGIILKNKKILPFEINSYSISFNGKAATLAIMHDISERIKYENQLEESNFLLSESQRIAHIGSWKWNIASKEIEWTDEAYSICGITPGDFKLTTESFMKLVHFEDQSAIREWIEVCKNGKATGSLDFRIILPEGSIRYVSIQCQLLKDKNGNSAYIMGTIQDITKIKLAFEITRESEEQYRTLFESSPDALILLNKNGFLDCNRQALTMFNVTSKEEFIKLQPSDLSAGMQKIDYLTKDFFNEKIMLTYYKGGQEFIWEAKRITGEEFIASAWLKIVTIQDEKLILATIRDISEEKKTENKLKESEERYRRFVEGSENIIYSVNEKGEFVYTNHAWHKALKYSKKESKKLNLFDIIDKEYYEHCRRLLPLIFQGKSIENIEIKFVSKNNETINVIGNVTPFYQDNKIIYTNSIFQNITELVGYRNELEIKVNERTKELNEALEREIELSKLKSRFVSMASHEFRTPLSAINFAAGSLKKYSEKLNQDTRIKKLEKIEEQVAHMTALLEDVLIVGKSEAGKITCNPQLVNFNEFIRPVIDEVYNTSDKTHKISLLNKNTDATILIDEKLGKNIFINLLNNAIKFSPGKKEVIIEVNSDNKMTRIKVIDFGLGIKEDNLENIFIPFQRGENVETIQGTGLGLAIVKQAVDLHKGEIKVNSIINEGTTFIVNIPKKQDNEKNIGY